MTNVRDCTRSMKCKKKASESLVAEQSRCTHISASLGGLLNIRGSPDVKFPTLRPSRFSTTRSFLGSSPATRYGGRPIGGPSKDLWKAAVTASKPPRTPQGRTSAEGRPHVPGLWRGLVMSPVSTDTMTSNEGTPSASALLQVLYQAPDAQACYAAAQALASFVASSGIRTLSTDGIFDDLVRGGA